MIKKTAKINVKNFSLYIAV